MKTYKETTDSIISKSEKIIRLKSIRKRKITRVASTALCLCVLLGACFGIWRANVPKGDQFLVTSVDNQNISNNELSVIDKKGESRKGESPMDSDHVSEDIYINYLSEVPSHAFYALREDMFTEMSKEEQMEYYGVDFDLSEILTEFREVNTNKYGVYFFEDGTECSSHVFQWTNSVDNISVELARGMIPLSAPFRMDSEGNWMDESELVQSNIDNVSVMICNYKDAFGNEFYHAEFLRNGIGYSVYSENLHETLFLNALAYLITNN